MDVDVRQSRRLAALACLAALTAALWVSVGVQGGPVAPATRCDPVLSEGEHARLVAAWERARTEGDHDLAEWIESLPMMKDYRGK